MRRRLERLDDAVAVVWCDFWARLPFVIQSRRQQWQAGKDAFDLGREYERYLSERSDA